MPRIFGAIDVFADRARGKEERRSRGLDNDSSQFRNRDLRETRPEEGVLAEQFSIEVHFGFGRGRDSTGLFNFGNDNSGSFFRDPESRGRGIGDKGIYLRRGKGRELLFESGKGGKDFADSMIDEFRGRVGFSHGIGIRGKGKGGAFPGSGKRLKRDENQRTLAGKREEKEKRAEEM